MSLKNASLNFRDQKRRLFEFLEPIKALLKFQKLDTTLFEVIESRNGAFLKLRHDLRRGFRSLISSSGLEVLKMILSEIIGPKCNFKQILRLFYSVLKFQNTFLAGF